MSATALAVTFAVAVALMLAVVTVGLGRQVRRLQTEVQVLAQSRAAAVREEPREPSAPSRAREGDLVLTPTPLGPPEVEPDLSVIRVVSVTLAGPLIKVAAFSHGVRRALAEESRMRVAYAFRKELRRQRKMRRKRAAGRPPRSQGRRP
jgi:hypothetical protein